MQVLAGRRGEVRTPKRVPVIGLVLVVLGVAAAALGSALAFGAITRPPVVDSGDGYLFAGLVAGGAGLTQIGLIVLSSAIMSLAGRLAGRLPLAPRLAMRDAARHRSRSAPAIAAVLAAVTGSVALSLFVASAEDNARRGYKYQLPEGAGVVSLVTRDVAVDGTETVRFGDPERARNALAATLPVKSTQVVNAGTTCHDKGCRYVDLRIPEQNRCSLWELTRDATEAELAAADSDPRCVQSTYLGERIEGTPVGGAELLPTLGAAPDARAQAVLQRGGIVVFHKRYVDRGHAELAIFEPSKSETTGDERPARVLRLPAAVAEPKDGIAVAPALYSAPSVATSSPRSVCRLRAGRA